LNGTANWIYDLGTNHPGCAANWGTGELETMTDDLANIYRTALTQRRRAAGSHGMPVPASAASYP
jgi:hypothetical protein